MNKDRSKELDKNSFPPLEAPSGLSHQSLEHRTRPGVYEKAGERVTDKTLSLTDDLLPDESNK